jgi:hypothetical protein
MAVLIEDGPKYEKKKTIFLEKSVDGRATIMFNEVISVDPLFLR